jgi:hypothetical protein
MGTADSHCTGRSHTPRPLSGWRGGSVGILWGSDSTDKRKRRRKGEDGGKEKYREQRGRNVREKRKWEEEKNKKK